MSKKTEIVAREKVTSFDKLRDCVQGENQRALFIMLPPSIIAQMPVGLMNVVCEVGGAEIPTDEEDLKFRNKLMRDAKNVENSSER